ncbi:MAG: O-antigen ligase family protein [Rhodothermales bacterium]|nr:O-antigen ligase family protein [Rhodothermales bacterium]
MLEIPHPRHLSNTWIIVIALAISAIPLVLVSILPPLFVLAIPVLGIGALFFWLIRRDDLLVLCAVLLAFAPVSGYEAGFQLSEIVYGLGYLSYLSFWLLREVLKRRYQTDLVDKTMFIFLVWVTVLFPLTFVFDGNPKSAISEWLSISMLAFFFPVRHLVRTDNRGLFYVTVCSLCVCVWIAARNFIEYQTGLSNAEYIWQIASSRVPTNEHVLMAGAICSVVLLMSSRQRRMQLLLLPVTLLLIGGVIIGQSRAVWVSLALGFFIAFLVSAPAIRRRFFVYAGLAGSALFVVGLILLDDIGAIVRIGLSDRLGSLSSAVSSDISLINRFIETRAVWDKVIDNPIVGYGFGVPYRYYSIVYELSWSTSFVHNTFVGLLYKHGLIGFVLVATFTFTSISKCISLLKQKSPGPQICAVVVISILVALFLASTTNNMLAKSDTTLALAILLGVACGTHDKATAKTPSFLE